MNTLDSSFQNALHRLNLDLSSVPSLSDQEKASCVEALSSISPHRFHEAKAFLLQSHEMRSFHAKKEYVPCDISELPSSTDSMPSHLGCILLAGGQATRMSLPEGIPKALLPITPIQKKTLLQLFLEKIAAAQEIFGIRIEVSLFVSESTIGAIRSFIDTKGSFGVPKEHISYIQQPSLPFLSDAGDFVLNDVNQIMMGPDGNGSLLFTMKQYGLFELWKKKGIQYVTAGPIDNPLLDPFHPALLTSVQKHDFVLTAIRKKSDTERVGVFAYNISTRGIEVIEYSELSSNIIKPPYIERDFQWANISQFAFQLDWAEAIWNKPLPWHIARKQSQNCAYCKMEQFFFDLLQYSGSPAIVPIDRGRYFAPIKYERGESSFEEAGKALQKKDRERFNTLFPSKEMVFSDHPLELHPFWDYYMPQSEEESEQLIDRAFFSSGYIKPRNADKL